MVSLFKITGLLQFSFTQILKIIKISNNPPFLGYYKYSSPYGFK